MATCCVAAWVAAMALTAPSCSGDATTALADCTKACADVASKCGGGGKASCDATCDQRVQEADDRGCTRQVAEAEACEKVVLGAWADKDCAGQPRIDQCASRFDALVECEHAFCTSHPDDPDCGTTIVCQAPPAPGVEARSAL